MTEDTMQIILVWVIFVHVLAEFIIHLETWRALRQQRHQTKVGPAFQSREAWLAIRHLLMLGFHFLLAWVVTSGSYPYPTPVRIILYACIVYVAIYASVAGIRLIYRIREESTP